MCQLVNVTMAVISVGPYGFGSSVMNVHLFAFAVSSVSY